MSGSNVTLTPDNTIIFHLGSVPINSTIFYTWVVMGILIAIAAIFRYNIDRQEKNGEYSQLQNILEMCLVSLATQAERIGCRQAMRFMPFLGTMFLFLLFANVLSVVPFYEPPTYSLSTTVAFALISFAAVPYYSFKTVGVGSYIKSYFEPIFVMFPLNVIGELSKILSLSIRLYGNMMSGTVIGVVILAIIPIAFPVLMQGLGLISGAIQAYIFTILSAVYIAAAIESEPEKFDDEQQIL